MASLITNYYENAQLSLAAYALGLTPGMGKDNPNYIQALKDAGMVENQAIEFTSRYSVIHQYTDPATGFSATIFQKDTETVIAFRGTELSFPDIYNTDLGDLLNDASLALGGIAADQIISMYNYYQRLVHQPGEAVPQLSKIVGDSGTHLYLDWVVGIGFGKQAEMTWPLTVTGHSLGGHLGMAFGRLFNSNVKQLYTYNTPGFGEAGANAFFNEVNRALGISQPSTYTYLDDTRSTNLYGSGENIVAGFATTYGTDVPVFLENNTHSIVALTDSLAVYNLFATIAPTVSVSAVTDILKASANTTNKSLESALDSLRTLFQENYALGTPETNAAPTTVDDRDSFYTNLFSLQHHIENLPTYDSNTKSLRFTVESLVGKDVTALLSSSQTDIATRYALYKLNPFVIRNADDLYNTINNSNGALDIYNPATSTGSLTEQYFKDRSAFLVNKIWSGTNDKTTVSGDALALRLGFPQYFEDRGGTSPYKLYLGEDRFVSDIPTSGLTQIVFGGENAETITGGDKWDKLYGMAGDDTLQGKQGNDYLEGGQGTDTYTYTSGDGLDTILDTDGLGKITFDGAILNGGQLLFGETYKSADGKYLYTLLANATGQNLLISGMGGQIVVKDFQNTNILMGAA